MIEEELDVRRMRKPDKHPGIFADLVLVSNPRRQTARSNA